MSRSVDVVPPGRRRGRPTAFVRRVRIGRGTRLTAAALSCSHGIAKQALEGRAQGRYPSHFVPVISMGENFVGDEHPRLVSLLPLWKQFIFPYFK